MKKVGMMLLAGLLLTPAAAPSQTIRGVVIEDGTRNPIAGVSVELIASTAQRIALAQTDSVGEFVLVPRRSGDYTLRLTHLGYVPVDSVTLLLRPGEAIEIELRMGHAAIPLEPLVVTARMDSRLAGYRERLRQRERSFGRFVTRAEIEKRSGARATDLLQQTPGIYLVPARPSGNFITMRCSPGQCMPTLYIDGMMVKQFSPVDDFITADMLEGVEVYTGLSAPSPIHSLNNCGVVAFWTRTGEGVWSKWNWKRLAAGAGGSILAIVLTRSLAR